MDTKKIADALNPLLADTFVLYVKTLAFHWNVEDSRFAMLHQLFEDQYNDLAGAADLLAEQVRIVGHFPAKSMAEFTKLSSLSEAKGDESGDQMVATLAADNEALAESLRKAIPACQEAGDEGSADLLIERLRVHTKAAWMLKSHRK